MTTGLPRWSTPSQALHWLMALLIFAQFALGWVAESWRLSPTKLSLMMWHKSVGLVLLVLVMLRLGWIVVETPPPPMGGGTLRKRLRVIAVLLLYVCMFAMPLTGWVINSAANVPFRLFGLFPVPDLVEPSKFLQQSAESMHLVLSWFFALLLVAHVGNAIYHQLVCRDGMLQRMLPVRFSGDDTRRSTGK